MLIRVQLAEAGSVWWNGRLISHAKLREYLNTAAQLNPLPFVGLEIAPNANCAAVEPIRAVMERAILCKSDHLCGEGSGFVAREANIE